MRQKEVVKTASNNNVLKTGSIQWSLYKQGQTWRAYTTYAGRRYFFQRKNLEDLKVLLKEKANRMVNRLVTITQREAEDYLMAQELLKPFSIDLIEAAKFYATKHTALISSATCYEASSKFLEAKLCDGASYRYANTLRHYLDKFCGEFAARKLSDVDAPSLNEWLRKQDISPRSRNNLRSVIVTFFLWARDEAGLLPPTERTEAERMARAKVVTDETMILSPQNFHQLLKDCKDDNEAVIFLALGGLAGLRSIEIERLHWEDIRWDARVIEIAASKSKTASRRLVPILPALKKILFSLKSLGRVVPKGVQAHVRPFAVKLMGQWHQNCLRHSWISYRLASTGDINRTAQEAGNSPAKIYQNYRALKTPEGELVTEELAKTWWG